MQARKKKIKAIPNLSWNICWPKVHQTKSWKSQGPKRRPAGADNHRSDS